MGRKSKRKAKKEKRQKTKSSGGTESIALRKLKTEVVEMKELGIKPQRRKRDMSKIDAPPTKEEITKALAKASGKKKEKKKREKKARKRVTAEKFVKKEVKKLGRELKAGETQSIFNGPTNTQIWRQKRKEWLEKKRKAPYFVELEQFDDSELPEFCKLTHKLHEFRVQFSQATKHFLDAIKTYDLKEVELNLDIWFDHEYKMAEHSTEKLLNFIDGLEELELREIQTYGAKVSRKPLVLGR
jgi:hypothetical protein